MSGHMQFAKEVQKYDVVNMIKITIAGGKSKTYVYIMDNGRHRMKSYVYKNSSLNTYGGYRRALGEVAAKVNQFKREIRDACIEHEVLSRDLREKENELG